MRRWTRRWLQLKPPSISLYLFLAVPSICLAWHIVRSEVLHADLLYFESFYVDVILHRRPFSEFQFTEANFLFPDFLVMSLLRSFVGAIPAIVVFSGLVVTSITVSLTLVYRSIWLEQRAFPWPLAAGVLLAFALASSSWIYHHSAYFPQHHAALQLFFIYCFYQVVNLESWPRDVTIRFALMNFCLSLALVFSDLLTLPSNILPTCLVLGLRIRSNANRTAFLLPAFLVLGAAAGLLLRYDLEALHLLHMAHRVLLPESGTAIQEAAVRFVATLPEILRANALLFAVSSMLGLAAAVVRPTHALPSAARDAEQWYILLAGATLAVKLAAILIAARWDGIYDLRYLQELSFLPLIWLALFALPRFDTPTTWIKMAVSLASLAWLGFFALRPRPALFLQRYDFVACIDAHADELPTPWGLAGFWIAKPGTFTSKEGLHVNQITDDGSKYNWQNSPTWYTEDVFGRAITQSTFVIAPPGALALRSRTIWGEPTGAFTCPSPWGHLQISIYPEGVQTR